MVRDGYLYGLGLGVVAVLLWHLTGSAFLVAVPVLLGLEKRTNPFLRASEPALAASVGLSDQSALAVFTALREAKNKA
jgi:hypothetical protein